MYVAWCPTFLSWFVSLKYNFEGWLLHRIGEKSFEIFHVVHESSFADQLKAILRIYFKEGKRRRVEVDHVLQLSLSDVMGRGAPI